MSVKWKALFEKLGVWQPAESSDRDPHGEAIARKFLQKWKVNTIDQGSIYSIQPKNIAGREMPLPKRPPTAQEVHLMDTDLSNKVERRYISRSRIASPTTRTFKKHIIQKYNAPPRDMGLGYRMPRPPKERRDEHELAVEAIRKKPTVIRTATMAALSRPVRCGNDPGDRSHIYCEVLGPAACSSCIESTNKCMAEELQRRLFPGIDTSTNSLVAPRVAEVLCKRDFKSYRASKRQPKAIPYIRDGVVDYRSLRKKSTVTDRFRHLKVAAIDVAQDSPSNLSANPKRRRKQKQSKLPALANLLKALV